MTARHYCNGPGHKLIFATKASAQAELSRRRKGRRARVGQGMVQSCTWALGEHWHVTSHKKPYGGGKH